MTGFLDYSALDINRRISAIDEASRFANSSDDEIAGKQIEHIVALARRPDLIYRAIVTYDQYRGLITADNRTMSEIDEINESLLLGSPIVLEDENRHMKIHSMGPILFNLYYDYPSNQTDAEDGVNKKVQARRRVFEKCREANPEAYRNVLEFTFFVGGILNPAIESDQAALKILLEETQRDIQNGVIGLSTNIIGVNETDSGSVAKLAERLLKIHGTTDDELIAKIPSNFYHSFTDMMIVYQVLMPRTLGDGLITRWREVKEVIIKTN